jgi:hypothetical protein
MLGKRRKWPAIDPKDSRIIEMGVAGEEQHRYLAGARP